eukprot:1149788-Pelagomonas_calceolata.AAC.1
MPPHSHPGACAGCRARCPAGVCAAGIGAYLLKPPMPPAHNSWTSPHKGGMNQGRAPLLPVPWLPRAHLHKGRPHAKGLSG